MDDELQLKLKTENAIIRSTMLGYEDHGIFTCMLYLKREVGEQGFGGYALGAGKNPTIKTAGYGLAFIREILDTVGVDTWEELKGKHIRIRANKGWNEPIEAIGNFMSDKWFYPKEFSKSFNED